MVEFIYIGFRSIDLAVKHSPEIFKRVETGVLERPFQKLSISLFYPFLNPF